MLWKNKIKPTVEKEVIDKYLEFSSGKLPVCNAPFSSLYFHPDGEVGSCCLNKTWYSLGKYPGQTLSEIINSRNRKLQQRYIAKNNLSLGCNICNENLNSGNFAGVMAFDYKNLKPDNKIRRIDFELSDFCNFNCVMCERDKSDKKIIYDDAFIKELYQYLIKLKSTNFLGGEPFLIKIYYKIWDIIINENPECNINIQTNGSVYNEKIAELAKNKKVFISLSIDSVKKETYEFIRKGSDFNLIMKNFSLFNSAMSEKKHSMYISVCPTVYNYKEIPDIVKFANDNKCRIFFNRVMSPLNISLESRTTEEYDKILNIYESAYENMPSDKLAGITNKRTFNDFINLIRSLRQKSATDNKVSISCDYVRNIIKNRKNETNKNKIELIEDVLAEYYNDWKISPRKTGLLASDFFWQDYENLFETDKSATEIISIIKNFLELENNNVPLE